MSKKGAADGESTTSRFRFIVGQQVGISTNSGSCSVRWRRACPNCSRSKGNSSSTLIFVYRRGRVARFCRRTGDRDRMEVTYPPGISHGTTTLASVRSSAWGRMDT